MVAIKRFKGRSDENLTGLNCMGKILYFLKIRRNKIMKEPVLVVMAAGMGSRCGGLKQIDPVDQEGHIIMDFSIMMRNF